MAPLERLIWLPVAEVGLHPEWAACDPPRQRPACHRQNKSRARASHGEWVPPADSDGSET